MQQIFMIVSIIFSGAEVFFTGDLIPDAANLSKQARQMGIKLPFANIYAEAGLSALLLARRIPAANRRKAE
jgi:hypothetical protein